MSFNRNHPEFKLPPDKGGWIRVQREMLGLSQRKLASKLGVSTRRLKAAEANGQPKAKKEQAVHERVFIPYLGYAVHKFSRRPVADRFFHLGSAQNFVIHSFGELW